MIRETVENQRRIFAALRALLHDLRELLLHLVIETTGLRHPDRGNRIRQNFRSTQHIEQEERGLPALDESHETLGGDDLRAGNTRRRRRVHRAIMQLLRGRHAEILTLYSHQLIEVHAAARA